MNKKQLIYAILFCSVLFLYYAPAVPVRIGDFISACDTKGLVVSGLQEWILSIVGVVYSLFAVAIIVGIFAYWFRQFNIFFYLAFGFLGRFVIPLILILPFLKGKFNFSDLANFWFGASLVSRFGLISHIVAPFLPTLLDSCGVLTSTCLLRLPALLPLFGVPSLQGTLI